MVPGHAEPLSGVGHGDRRRGDSLPAGDDRVPSGELRARWLLPKRPAADHLRAQSPPALPVYGNGRARATTAPRRRAAQERARLQHGPLLSLSPVAVLSRRLRRARVDGVGGTTRVAVRGQRRLPGPRGAERARHGDPRPQPPVGDHLGAPASTRPPNNGSLDARDPPRGPGAGQLAADQRGDARHGRRPVGTRTCSGYDDYHTENGAATLLPPLPGVPYLVTEAVGVTDGAPCTAGSTTARRSPSRRDARPGAQPRAVGSGLRRGAGLGRDRLRLAERRRSASGTTSKWAGVLDIFRVPKPGASFYRSQGDPTLGPVILPAFFWDFGPGSPPAGRGRAR